MNEYADIINQIEREMNPVKPKPKRRIYVSLEHNWGEWIVGIYYQCYAGAWDVWIHFLPTLSISIHGEN